MKISQRKQLSRYHVPRQLEVWFSDQIENGLDDRLQDQFAVMPWWRELIGQVWGGIGGRR